MEKFEETYNKWCKCNEELYNDCKDYLNNILDKLPENSCEIDEDEPCYCTYDGGGHPEYASNCFSQVYRVFKKNDKIYLDIEDCYDYGINRIDACTLCDITYAVSASVEKNFDLEE